MIHFAIVNGNGEIEGQGCKIVAASNQQVYDNFPIPAGCRKVLLTFEEYEKLSTDFDEGTLTYNCKVDLIESKAIKMTDIEKADIIARRPEWVRDTKMPDGRVKREKKDGKILEIKPDGIEIAWKDKP